MPNLKIVKNLNMNKQDLTVLTKSKKQQLLEMTYEDIVECKKLDGHQIQNEFCKIRNKKITMEHSRSFIGNPLIMNYMMDELCSTERVIGVHKFKTRPSLKALMEDSKSREEIVEWTLKRNRSNGEEARATDMFEAWRINKGSIVTFKTACAKALYSECGATHVLDPTAGWGGRALGTLRRSKDGGDIAYTGIDTNPNLIKPYERMIKDGSMNKVNMIWESCLDVDFSKIDYDMVLTSPPYINLELYNGMEQWDNEDDFYFNFLIPLLNKCRENIKEGGWVVFNMPSKMYVKLTKPKMTIRGKTTYSGYGYDECTKTWDFLQNKNGEKGKKAPNDLCYGWQC